MSSPQAKNIPLSLFRKLRISCAVPLPMKGRTRRHERGAECGGRGRADRRTARSADGKVVWSWRAHAGAKSARSSKGFARVTVANAGSPRRAPISRKTTAQGRPVVTACTCGFRARANCFCARARVHAATRPSLRPLTVEGDGRCKARAKRAAGTRTYVYQSSLQANGSARSAAR